jgi:hypothetical protein
MEDQKKTVVLGASPNPERYSYVAVRQLQEHKIPVVPVGRRTGVIEGETILTGEPDVKDVHTVTLYLNSNNQKQYYDYILSLHPKRIIFNPGAENPELAVLAQKNGIKAENTCTLVMLSVGNF